MEHEKYKLTNEQQLLFEKYKSAVKYTIYKNFYSLAKSGDILEIENIGYLGLIYAIKTYDERKGCNMLTWIINNIRFVILRYIKQNKKLEYISTETIEICEQTGQPYFGCGFTISGDYSERQEEQIDKEQTIELLNRIAKEKLSGNRYAVYEKLYLERKSVLETSKELSLSRNRVYQIDKRNMWTLKRVCREKGVLND